MSFHRIFLIGACVLCTITAFANNEAIKCGDKWPCNYKKTYYVHKKARSHNTNIPEPSITLKGRSLLHFHPNEIKDRDAAEIICSNDTSCKRCVRSGTKVYSTGHSRSYKYPAGYHFVSREEGKNKGWGSNGWNDWVVDDKSDSNRWHDDVFPYWKTEEGYDEIWRCENNNWTQVGKIKNGLKKCDDEYQVLAHQNNKKSGWAAVQELYLHGGDGNDNYLFGTIIAENGEKPCLTYRCRSGYQSDCDLDNESCPDARCKQENKSCEIKKSGDKKYMVTTESVTDTCLGSNYKGADNDVGVKYIKNLKQQMNKSLNANKEVAKQMDDKGLKDIRFTFNQDSGDYELDEEIFRGLKCDFYCDTNGYKVRLKPQGDENGNWTLPCPKYFKGYVSGDDYTCVFDVDAANAAIQGAKETAAKNAKDACQDALCKATGGTMNESGACMCGTTNCDSAYTDSNGNTYYYCGSKLDDYEVNTLYCNPAEGQYWTDTTTEIKNAVSNMKATFKELCSTSNATSDASTSKTDIPTLVANLSKIESEFGLSKWRTAEGKFNYARLASDATAGIVLGTTGALVTAHVVKKKQVEDGFESLECTVGGQHVGDWGDVFRIDGK